MEENVFKERIRQLRKKMQENKIDIYLVPTADYHESEYVGDFFKVREFLSGFTGSAGTLVVTDKEAGLWTDGRYFIQAEKQLAGSGITLYKSGMKDVCTVKEYIVQQMPQSGTLGFDGRVVNTTLGEELENALKKLEVRFAYEKDLTRELWADRPELRFTPAWLLDVKYCGEERAEKLARVRSKMQEKDAEILLLTTLDDIAWLFNLRGNDIMYNPVVLSYALITQTKCTLYMSEKAITQELSESFGREQIALRPYGEVYEDVKQLRNQTAMLDKKKVNYYLTKSLDESMTIIDTQNPTIPMKAVKNETELANLKKSHIKDGVAVTKLMYYLKTNIGKIPMTEISIADYQEELRRKQEGFLQLSFDTISAYKENAAMMHYSATAESNATLKPEGFLLMDSGGQYYEGTTDITRTYVLGALSAEQKKHFTLVAKSMLNLMHAKFLYGCTGNNLDILARGPLWNIGIDYRCGTGHGVGYLLNVHEAPNGFRWKIVPERQDSHPLEAGMVTTDEPGVYIEGSHGIRTENELICKKGISNKYGQFMEFETITYVPIDLDGIDINYLNEEDIRQLNEYHAIVYEIISPYLTKEEQIWLQEYTRAI